MRIALAVVLACAGCFSGRAQECTGSDGVTRLCPAGSTCLPLGATEVCATPDQVQACSGMTDGAPCAVGFCHDQICLPVVCGDGRVDPPEQCEPGAGPCASDCLSDLSCGNGVVDTAMGEQCDDGNLISHDGCDARCRPEFPRWTELTPEIPPVRSDTAMAYDPVRGTIVMFGGATLTNTKRGDTWIRVFPSWLHVQPFRSPSARSGHAMAYDGKTGRVYLYGGVSQTNPLAELWAWDGATWHFIPPIAGDDNPPALEGASMVYDAHRQVLVLVGGVTTDPTKLDAETYEYDGTHWHHIAGATLVPARRYAAMAYDPTSKTTLVFGGRGLGSPGIAQLADTQIYDGVSWKPVAPAFSPAARERAQLGFDGKRLVLTGGIKDTDTTSSDAGVYVWSNGNWQVLTANGPPVWGAGMSFEPAGLAMFGGIIFVAGTPTITSTIRDWSGSSWTQMGLRSLAIARAGAALDLDLATPVLFGGFDVNQLYELVDGVWVNPATPAATGLSVQPSPRTGSALAYDEAHRAVVMFGGAVPGAADEAMTYTWATGSGGAPTTSTAPMWTTVAQDGPSPRTDLAMAYDAADRVVMLFGGRAGAAVDGDCWSWDGTAWSPAPAGPVARYGHAMAYDRTHGEIVMFGGRVNESPTNETWIFGHGAWRLIPLPPAGTAWPSARVGPALAWDPSRRRIVLVGGQSQILEQDTWEWNGLAWTQVPVVAPPARTSGALVGTADGLVLTGGASDFNAATRAPGITTELADVWLFRYEGAETGSSCRDGGDDDGDGLAGCADPDCWLACHPACLPGDSCAAELPHCGDNTCNGIETADLCPMDGCRLIPACGNGACDGAMDCPGDCP